MMTLPLESFFLRNFHNISNLERIIVIVKRGIMTISCFCFVLFVILSLIFFLHIRFHIHNDEKYHQLQTLLDLFQHSTCVFDNATSVYKLNCLIFYYCQQLPNEMDQQILCGIKQLLARNIPNVRFFQTILLKGAHIIVAQDNGLFYQWFKSQKHSYTRLSSHKSHVPVFSIPIFQNKSSIITGIYPINNSWFQFEADIWKPFEKPILSFFHALNFIYYKIFDHQVGPFGTCSYTDQRPFLTYIDTDQFPKIFTNTTSGKFLH